MTTGRINQIAIAIPRRRRRVVMVCLTGLAWSPAQRYPPPSYHLVWFSVALMLVGSFTLLKEARVTLSRDKQLTSAVTSFSLTASRRHLLVSFIIRHQLVPSIQSRSVWESYIWQSVQAELCISGTSEHATRDQLHNWNRAVHAKRQLSVSNIRHWYRYNNSQREAVSLSAYT